MKQKKGREVGRDNLERDHDQDMLEDDTKIEGAESGDDTGNPQQSAEENDSQLMAPIDSYTVTEDFIDNFMSGVGFRSFIFE